MKRGGLSVFLPWSLDSLLKEAVSGCAPHKAQEGCVLFCDVAGFTPLTEALSVLGREGAEELTRLLNGYFTRMIGILDEEGGDVLRFGGDAMTVFFPGNSKERAARSALRMMEAMEAFSALPTRAGEFSLSMKIGASFGPVHLGLTGSAEEGWDYYAAGTPLDDAADAEHHAVPGRIILHPSFLAQAPEEILSEPIEGGFARLAGMTGEAPSPVEPPSPPAEELLRTVVPRHLADRAGEGCLGEHRGTAVVFLSIKGLSWENAASNISPLNGDDIPLPVGRDTYPGPGEDGYPRLRVRNHGASRPHEAHERLRLLYSHFAALAKKYGGSLNKIDFGDKGAKAIFLFGVPFACERKEEMATRAALELLAPSPATEGLRLRGGITSAPLFSGPVGSPSRREFTVMGDGINLSARLMGASADGESLASREVAEAAGTALRFLTLAPITVKGKRNPVAIFAPQGERADSHRETGLLLERESAQEALRQDLFEGKGKVPLFEAEAGLGKSALASWALREARAREIPVLWIPLAPFSTGRPFGAFRALVRVLLGAEKGDPPARLTALRDAALADEEPGYRVVLNTFLDLPEESTSALKGLSPKERKELSFAVVKRLLERSGERAILLDGLQWADPLSLDLLSFLLADAAQATWRLALFSRPGVLPDALRANAEPLPLEPLSAEGTRRLLEEGHQISGLSATGTEWFSRKARGNPALCAALVRSLEEAGLLREEAKGLRRLDEDRLAATAFPDTLEGLYLRKVDALAPTERQVLQEAAVLGYSVSLHLLGRISGAGDETARSEALKTLTGKGFLREDTRGERPYTSFAETLLRDAVYGAIPFGLRRPIHLRVLKTLLEMEGEQNARLWPTLAHHAEQGGDEERAKRFHRLAGREALDRFDNLSALSHLEFVCAASSAEFEEVEDAFRLMDVYGVLGRRENAVKLLETLRPLGPQMAVAQRARLFFFEARERWQRQAWEEAERLLLEGLELYKACGDTSGVGKSYVNLVGGIYGPTGQLDKAKEALEKALALPRGAGQAVWRTTAAMNLGVVLWHGGNQDDAAKRLRAAYREAVQGGLGPQKGQIADNLCALLGEMGQFEEAAKWGQRATNVLDAFAVRSMSLSSRYNLALSIMATGRTKEANALFDVVRANAVTSGFQQMVGQSHQGIAQVSAMSGDICACLDHTEASLRAFLALENGRDLRFSAVSTGNLFVAIGAPDSMMIFWKEQGLSEALAVTAGDPAADLGLARLDAWKEGRVTGSESVAGFLAAGQEYPEEKLERLLWVAEGSLQVGEGSASATNETVERALSAWPYFDARLRVLRLELLACGTLSPPRKAEALRLLSRCMGGIWGLRLLCLLYERESSRAKARALRQRALNALYFVHAHSPAWAWEKVAVFPEVKSVLRGFKTVESRKSRKSKVQSRKSKGEPRDVSPRR